MVDDDGGDGAVRWTYDTGAGAFYLTLKDGLSASQEELRDGMILDFAADGEIIGIEVIGYLGGLTVELQHDLEARGVPEAAWVILGAVTFALLRNRSDVGQVDSLQRGNVVSGQEPSVETELEFALA